MEGLIKCRLETIQTRNEIKKFIKYKTIEKEAMTQTFQHQVKDYEFYLCDKCQSEIKITKNREELTGGIVELESHITGLDNKIKLALHTKCLNPVLNEFKKILQNV